jgi:integrase
VIPVHPALGALLRRWWLGGWARAYGRAPTISDRILLAPALRAGEPAGQLCSRRLGRWLEAALVRLDLRPRRLHDLRRTFVSLGRDHGCSEAIWARFSHPRAHDARELYADATWAAQCAEVLRLPIELRDEGTQLALL